MRCRPRPGSRFYTLDRLLRRRECWEPLYDLITPPLRRGRNARRRSGIRHVFAPPPTPSFRVAGFEGPFIAGPTYTEMPQPTHPSSPFFRLSTPQGSHPPFPRSSPVDKMASTRQPTQPTWRCLRLQRAFTPLTKRDGKAEPDIVTWLLPPTG